MILTSPPIKNDFLALLPNPADFTIKFQANNIDFYMNGHDHCLEHISDTKR